MFRHVWTCLNMFEHVWTCLNMSEHVWACHCTCICLNCRCIKIQMQWIQYVKYTSEIRGQNSRPKFAAKIRGRNSRPKLAAEIGGRNPRQNPRLKSVAEVTLYISSLLANSGLSNQVWSCLNMSDHVYSLIKCLIMSNHVSAKFD
jgi:hypothetical protein